MTNDPERLLSVSNSSSVEHELLSSLRNLAPPASADDEVWTGLTRQLALSGLVGAAALTAPKTAAAAGASLVAPGAASVAGTSLFASVLGKSLTVKLIALASIGAVGTGAVYVALAPQAPSAPAMDEVRSAGVATPAQPLAPVAPPIDDTAQPTTTQPQAAAAPEAALAGSQKTPAAQSRDDALARESALLVQARGALRAGQTARARSLLSELKSRYSQGMLSQEREVLNIELLAASGEQNAAAQRARAFIAKHPKSPHAGKLARFLDAP